MSYKISVGAILILFLFGCIQAQDVQNEPAKVKEAPIQNVLFIVVDDLTKTLGTYGHTVVKTPNVDRLAKMGIQFNNAYCNYSVCNPSRSSLLTGLKPETINILDNRKPIQEELGDRITLPALFKQNGFYTISLGKIFHKPEEEYNDLKAWDEIYNYTATALGKKGEKRNMTNEELRWCHWQAAEGDDEDQPDGQVTKKAVEFINAKRDKPFFLAVGLQKPHDPFIAPKKYFDMYPLENCDPALVPMDWETPYNHTLPGATKIFDKFTDQDKREFLRSYYACSSFMDAQVGKLLEALEKSKQMENTLIVFFGDHGYHLGEHNWWNKVTLFEQGTNAPFIVAGPGTGTTGVKSEAMFEFIDIYPTLAELLHLKDVPEYLEGKSFADVIKDPSQSFRNEVYAIIHRGNLLGKSIKNREWRYIEWAGGERGRELYDQRNDPMEYSNLAENPEYAVVVSTMSELLHQRE